MKSATITTEFLLDVRIPPHWFDDLTRVWNESLDLLNWLQAYRRMERFESLDLSPAEIKIKKVGQDWVGFCDIVRDFRIDRTKSWEKENIETRPCCNIFNSKWRSLPPISDFGEISLKKCFAQKRCQWLLESDIPSCYVNDFIGLTVIPSWEQYQKGKKQKPRYKYKKTDKIKTIKSASFRMQCRFKANGKLHLPGLPDIDVHRIKPRLLNKIDKMVEQMRRSPSDFPRLQNKLEKIMQTEAIKLGKDEGWTKEEIKERKAELLAQVNQEQAFEKAIAYFSSPGSFSILEREGKTYLQLTAELPITAAETEKQVGVDLGLDYLVDTTSGLRVKHKKHHKELARIDTLNARLSKMKYGSNNYNKLLDKINAIRGKVRRSKKGRQAFYAQQIADVNGAIAVKRVKVQDTIENPLPKKSKSGKYLPNGKSDARLKNREILDCAISQFSDIIKQQSAKKNRVFSLIEIEAEATPQEVLEVANFPSVSAASKSAQNPSGTREGEQEIAPIITGKVRPTGNNNFVSAANPPVPKEEKRRNRKREKQII